MKTFGVGTAATLTLAVLCFGIGIAIWAGCDSSQNPTGPTETTELSKRVVMESDGIRVNGTETDATHPEVRTYEVWFGGQKMLGPSPLGNYWTKADADWALVQVQNGIK